MVLPTGILNTPEYEESQKTKREAAQEIEERGGIDFATAMANLGAGYAFSSPEIRTRRTRSDVRQDLKIGTLEAQMQKLINKIYNGHK